MANGPIKIAIIAGEASGDHLGADLVAQLRRTLGEMDNKELEIIGVGGEGLKAQGLKSLFDYSELSIIGLSAVLKQLPKLLWRIRQTARYILNAKPDLLLIIDSPDFTHRVAKIVHKKVPNLPIINYVCPTVWAWKPERAKNMAGYIDHVLAILPFEPEEVARLDGPPLTYIGHRLMENHGLSEARQQQLEKEVTAEKTFLLLPGSRNSEISNLLTAMKQAAIELSKTYPTAQFIIPTLKRFEERLLSETKDWPLNLTVCSGERNKWKSFAKADAALAASGTILLELALARVPCISIYKTDFLMTRIANRITTWSAALPNLIVGHPAVSEHYNEAIRPVALAKRMDRLATDTLERDAILSAFDKIYENMQVNQPPSEKGAQILIKFLTHNA